MNGKEKQNYLLQYNRANRRFEVKFLPKIKKALDGVVSSLISDLRSKGIRQAQADLSQTILNQQLQKPLLVMYREVGLFHGKQTQRRIKTEIGQKALGQNEQWMTDIIRILRETLLEYATFGVSQTLRDHLLLVLSDGIRSELTVDELVKILQADTFTRMQAERIVRTEVGRAANTGVAVASESFGFQMSKEWFAFRDLRTRGVNRKDKKDHYHMDGQTVDFEADFRDPRSGERIAYPMAPGGSAAMVINCRCTWAATPKRDARGRLIPIGQQPIMGSQRVVFELPKPNVREKPKFVPAKSINEAENYALENLGLKYANFKGINIEIANDMNKAIFNIKQVMPTIRTFGIGSAQQANKSIKQDIKDWFYQTKYYDSLVEKGGKDFADRMYKAIVSQRVSNVGKDTLAWSTGSKNITIKSTNESIDLSKYLGVYVNDKNGKSKEILDNIVKRNSESGWFTKDANDFGYIMTHELGHEIDKTIGFQTDKRFLEIFNREREFGVKQLSEKLSKYGATAGGNSRALKDEMIAEAWAEFMTSPSPRPLSKEIGELMLKKYFELNNDKINLDYGSWVSEIRKIIKQ